MNQSINALRSLTLPCLLMLAGISSAFGQIVSVPTGLSPGDIYRLVFVTDGTTAATSTNIATYNTFVTNQADAAPALAALGATWTIIGSTPTVSALLNTGDATPGGAPIYGLDGTEIAQNNAVLWGGTLSSGIDITQSDAFLGVFGVFTGTATDGNGTAGNTLGSTEVTNGVTATADVEWINEPSGNTLDTTLERVYAISSDLVVAPEPGSAVLIVFGVGALLGWHQRRSA